MEKSTEINCSFSDSEFIAWLNSRLQNIHGYDTNNSIISRLRTIMNKIAIYQKPCSDADLDKIISRYFIDFYLIRDNTTTIGYTNEERNNLRQSIKHIIADVLTNNVPKDILLK
jgi:hypothetical protein